MFPDAEIEGARIEAKITLYGYRAVVSLAYTPICVCP